MTHEVHWTSVPDSDCVITVTLKREVFKGSRRDFWTAVDEAYMEAEDVACREFTNRTGKQL